jgi:branched-chain amino acid transport system substrate-binding protein
VASSAAEADPTNIDHGLSARRVGRAAATGLAAALALAACAGPTGNARLDPAEASGDGTLRIGLILDNTGTQAFLNAPQLAAAQLAVKEINAAGGHKGKPVELLPSAVGTDTAAQAKDLVAAKADVVIGPTDSSRAADAIDVLARAKVAIISPANTAPGLSTYKSGGYYFRTAAAAAEDDAGTSIASKLVSVSGGSATNGEAGAPSAGAAVCTSYRECVAAQRAGKRPDYDGASGPINFDSNGDVTAAAYMVYSYGADNTARMTGSETARSAGS